MRSILPFELGKQHKVAKVICFHASKRFFSNWPVIPSINLEYNFMNCPTYVPDFSKKTYERRIPWSNKFGKYNILYLSIQCNNAISISKLKYTNTHTQITIF